MSSYRNIESVANGSTVTDSDDHQVPETMSSPVPPQVQDHGMIGMSCKLQNYQHVRKEKNMDFPNPYLMIGTCEA
ncbi:hypothetical protein F3Y22_tig00110788pilonHSYRG00205 [Hibiscus syriacus]|uniref:Uncharacterized protein n=1 Tax=Hibiscus syriacus TaxID=106335 RepID=A0A6A2ZSY2_HIBSY|nr:hypothetical protein F3Y22_tig00110788pilonHSYRG00205 [Hibiscus syriacus]